MNRHCVKSSSTSTRHPEPCPLIHTGGTHKNDRSTPVRAKGGLKGRQECWITKNIMTGRMALCRKLVACIIGKVSRSIQLDFLPIKNVPEIHPWRNLLDASTIKQKSVEIATEIELNPTKMPQYQKVPHRSLLPCIPSQGEYHPLLLPPKYSTQIEAS
mmetsp:Transcript_3538/g.4099  ORF Transcript_3538/g.4099 Transcript_3538/m.4099 type:complete len:158 (-) Transcript_3538:544-1017(-)